LSKFNKQLIKACSNCDLYYDYAVKIEDSLIMVEK